MASWAWRPWRPSRSWATSSPWATSTVSAGVTRGARAARGYAWGGGTRGGHVPAAWPWGARGAALGEGPRVGGRPVAGSVRWAWWAQGVFVCPQAWPSHTGGVGWARPFSCLTWAGWRVLGGRRVSGPYCLPLPGAWLSHAGGVCWARLTCVGTMGLPARQKSPPGLCHSWPTSARQGCVSTLCLPWVCFSHRLLHPRSLYFCWHPRLKGVCCLPVSPAAVQGSAPESRISISFHHAFFLFLSCFLRVCHMDVSG